MNQEQEQQQPRQDDAGLNFVRQARAAMRAQAWERYQGIRNARGPEIAALARLYQQRMLQAEEDGVWIPNIVSCQIGN